MKRLLYAFVRVNKKMCRALEERFPHFFRSAFGTARAQEAIRKRLADLPREGEMSLLEVGGIDRPLLERDGTYHYVGLDIDYSARCEEIYDDFRTQSVEAPIAGEFDAIFSITLLEHVPDNQAAAEQMLAALKPRGLSIHYLPGKGHPYAWVLRLVGPKLQVKLLQMLNEGGDPHGGYPTYFDRCLANQMARLLDQTGYENVHAEAYYGCTPYFRVLVPAHLLVVCLMNVAERMNWSYFASGFIVEGTRPAAG